MYAVEEATKKFRTFSRLLLHQQYIVSSLAGLTYVKEAPSYADKSRPNLSDLSSLFLSFLLSPPSSPTSTTPSFEILTPSAPCCPSDPSLILSLSSTLVGTFKMGHSTAEPHVNDGHLRYSYVDVHVSQTTLWNSVIRDSRGD